MATLVRCIASKKHSAFPASDTPRANKVAHADHDRVADGADDDDDDDADDDDRAGRDHNASGRSVASITAKTTALSVAADNDAGAASRSAVRKQIDQQPHNDAAAATRRLPSAAPPEEDGALTAAGRTRSGSSRVRRHGFVVTGSSSGRGCRR
jgi:hypothetical protein